MKVIVISCIDVSACILCHIKLLRIVVVCRGAIL